MKSIIISTVLATLVALPMSSRANNDHSAHAPSGASGAPMAMVDGVVKKVDKPAARVTLAHGPLSNLNMPAMTMTFAVKDTRGLASLKEGDKVRFMADRVDGSFTVVHLEVAGR